MLEILGPVKPEILKSWKFLGPKFSIFRDFTGPEVPKFRILSFLSGFILNPDRQNLARVVDLICQPSLVQNELKVGKSVFLDRMLTRF